jgi:hypothetical protein
MTGELFSKAIVIPGRAEELTIHFARSLLGNCGRLMAGGENPAGKFVLERLKAHLLGVKILQELAAFKLIEKFWFNNIGGL